MTALWTSFVLVSLAEMGDKTQLIAFSLASWYQRPWPVMWGIFLATVLNHGLASSLGWWLAGMIPHAALAWILGLGFIAFGFWTLVPDRAQERHGRERKWGPFATSAVVFFFAAMGVKTQLATLALGARFSSSVVGTIRTTLFILATDR